MPNIYVFRGLPGSGKTTLAKQMVGPKAVRVSRDDIRAALGVKTGVGSREMEQIVTDMEDAAIKSALKANKDAIVDATNLNARFSKRFFDFGADNVFFNDVVVPLNVAIEQDWMRAAEGGRHVGADVIRSIAKSHKIQDDGALPPAPKRREQPNLAPIAEWDDELPSAIIVDIDGTVADHVGIRTPYDTSRYHLDKPHTNVINIVNALGYGDYMMIVVSGRDAKFRPETTTWLNSERVHFDRFYMRPEDDRRPDDVVKAEIYEERIRGKFNVVGVFDDRGRVLRMWRAKGFTTFAVGDTDNNDF